MSVHDFKFVRKIEPDWENMDRPLFISPSTYEAAKKEGAVLRENENGTIHIGRGEAYYVCMVQKSIYFSPPISKQGDKT